MLKKVCFFASFVFSVVVHANDLKNGAYVELVNLNDDIAIQEGVGTGLYSFGAVVSKRTVYADKFLYQYNLGLGLSGVEDHDSFEQRVQYGSGGFISTEESSIFGLSTFADIGHAANLSERIHSFAGVGATYFYLNREISDCSGCKKERINLPLAAYAKLGLDFCGVRSCFRVNYRKFFSEDFESGFLVSWQIKR